MIESHPLTITEKEAGETTFGLLATWRQAEEKGTLLWSADLPLEDPLSGCSVSATEESPIHAALKLRGIPEQLWREIAVPAITIQHCVVPPLHGQVLVKVFDKGDLQTPILQKLLKAIGAELETSYTPNFWQYSKAEPEKMPPPVWALTTPNFRRALLYASGSKTTRVQELIYPHKENSILRAALMTCVEYGLIKGEFGLDWEWDEDENRAVPIPNPDVFIPDAIFGLESYARQLYRGRLGLLDTDLQQEELREELMDVLGVHTSQKLVDTLMKLDTGSFMSRFPEFVIKPVIFGKVFLFATNAVLTYSNFLKRISGACGGQSVIETVDPDAQKLQDIKGVPNYTVSSPDGRVNIFLSRSSGKCSNHELDDINS